MKHPIRIGLLSAALLGAGLVVVYRAERSRPGIVGASELSQGIDEAAITRRLEALQEEALRDPSLTALNERLGAEMKAAMEAADPGLAAELARVPALVDRAGAAERGGDAGELSRLGEELRAIESRYARAQSAALQSPGLSARVEEFNARLRDRMVEIDPAANQLFARFQATRGGH